MTSYPKKLLAEVFVPGGLPTFTYVPRAQHALELKLNDALTRLSKIVLVSGATKSGKTVLVRKAIAPERSVWVEGGAIRTEHEFWQEIAHEFHVPIERSQTFARSNEGASATDVTASAKLMGSGVDVKLGDSQKAGENFSEGQRRTVSLRSEVIRILKDERLTLVVDDFHYMPKEVQSAIVMALKQPVFNGLKVVLLSVPHRTSDAVKAESEVEGRVKPIIIPPWEEGELRDIALAGFRALNASVDSKVLSKLTEGSLQSPHLCQDLCSLLCARSGISEECDRLTTVTPPEPLDLLFEELAKDMDPTAFSKLRKGPPRTNRLDRTLRNGSSCDIYEATLFSIVRAGAKPELSYSDINSAMREIVQGSLPQQHETTRVLEQMGKIALKVGKVPPLDFDKDLRVLHITDPFFRFYLRWGVQRAWE